MEIFKNPLKTKNPPKKMTKKNLKNTKMPQHFPPRKTKNPPKKFKNAPTVFSPKNNFCIFKGDFCIF